MARPRPVDAPTATRGEFITALKVELPAAVAHLQRGNIAPVDLAQAAIGPSKAIYTHYDKVLDADSRWALAWFEQSRRPPHPVVAHARHARSPHPLRRLPSSSQPRRPDCLIGPRPEMHFTGAAEGRQPSARPGDVYARVFPAPCFPEWTCLFAQGL
jgi:hypothetical protein